jgi:hypothetical protein
MELHLDAEEIGDLAAGSVVLWLTVREGHPRLRVYYVLFNDTCELRWLEIDPEWSAANLTAWRLISSLWPDSWGQAQSP